MTFEGQGSSNFSRFLRFPQPRIKPTIKRYTYKFRVLISLCVQTVFSMLSLCEQDYNNSLYENIIPYMPYKITYIYNSANQILIIPIIQICVVVYIYILHIMIWKEIEYTYILFVEYYFLCEILKWFVLTMYLSVSTLDTSRVLQCFHSQVITKIPTLKMKWHI